jgi:nitrogen fixation-related uncharacterized protein
MSIVGFWLAYAILATPVFAVFFYWAMRAGQFRSQDRARSLPLQEAGFEELPAEEGGGRFPVAGWVPIAFAVVVLCLMGTAIYISAANPPH